MNCMSIYAAAVRQSSTPSLNKQRRMHRRVGPIGIQILQSKLKVSIFSLHI